MYEDEYKEELKRVRCESLYVGRASALEDLEKEINQMAGQCYINHQDDLADFCRRLAIQVGKKALDERKKQKDYAPKFSGGV